MMFSRPRLPPDDHPSFAALPVTRYTVGPADEQVAVHISGRLAVGRVPLVCVPGYQRNMTDFADFANRFHSVYGDDWPVVLVDLKGRGRSSDRTDKSRYISTVDALDLIQVLAALAVDGGIFVGQGYGGQVVMALAAERPKSVLGAVLVDAGPVSDPRGLVRLRNNLRDLEGNRSEAGFRTMARRMLAPDYPAAPEGLLDVLAARTHYLDKRNRVRALFDAHLAKLLEAFEHDDILVPQWPLYEALAHSPLLLMRTQLTEQLRRETFEEMLRRRRDAEGYVIEGSGSPALLNTDEDVGPIAEFVRRLLKRRPKAA
ncbi:alpha/beta fold hydrolase [Devosia sp. A16]|uniref:alpha/beta fold hydrolase n=1 Tax=Devosia sp. A16 TaxID=1736675 RepID=UPI0006D77FBC|nr:alpha/beta hydrolase [Devosia sp. A16]